MTKGIIIIIIIIFNPVSVPDWDDKNKQKEWVFETTSLLGLGMG